MSIYTRITDKLHKELNIYKLQVEDQSHLHEGHAGFVEGGETHFKLIIVSDDFIHKNKLQRHKIIYKILEKEIAERIHALSIKAFTKEEYKDQ